MTLPAPYPDVILPRQKHDIGAHSTSDAYYFCRPLRPPHAAQITKHQNSFVMSIIVTGI